MKDQSYTWRVGDVFTDGTHRWAVDSVHGEKAILRSCGSSWATTTLLTFSEWSEGGRWRLEDAASAELDEERVADDAYFKFGTRYQGQ
jgi:hypothetical protein